MREQDQTSTIEPSEIDTWHGPQALRALRHRDFGLYWIGFIVSNIGSAMQNTAQSWLVYEITGSELYLGVVAAAATLPMLFLTLPSGVWADRFSKRKITIVTQSLMLIQAALLAALTYAHSVQPWHIVALAAFAGIANAIDIPARQAMTVEIVGKEDLLNAGALNSSAFNVARVVGPCIAGPLVALGGTQLCFLINSISFLAVIVGLVLIQPTPCCLESNGVSLWAHIREGLGYARRNVLIKDILILTGLASVFGMQYGTLMPAFAKTVLHAGPKGLGALQAAAGGGALVGAISIAALGDRFRKGQMMVGGSVVAPIGLIAFAFSRSLASSLAYLLVAGFGMMMFMAVSNNLVQTDSPDELRGRLLSVRTLVFLGLAPLGAVQIGWLAQTVGIRTSLAASAVVTLFAVFAFGLRSRAMRGAE